MFALVLDAYQETLDDAQMILEAEGFSPTTRVKSTGTLVDKLRRGTSFKSVQDVAGARVVVDGGRVNQDRAVTCIVSAFESAGDVSKVLDRRATPNHGYRAVHVIVAHQELPVEVQVRTPLQDLWAQIVERLGDLWGRELRYGEPLVPPNLPLVPGMSDPDFTREDFVDLLLTASEAIDHAEREVQMRQPGQPPDAAHLEVEQSGAASSLLGSEDVLLKTMQAIMDLVKKLEGG